MFDRMMGALGHVRARIRSRIGDRLFNVFSPAGALSRDIPSGLLAIWTSVLLGIVLLIAYLA